MRFQLIRSLTLDVTQVAGEGVVQPGIVGIVVGVSPIQSDLPPLWRPPPPHCCCQGPTAVPLSAFKIKIKQKMFCSECRIINISELIWIFLMKKLLSKSAS